MDSTLRVGSLFAGIGGFDLGLERAGMKTLWQVEPDFFCRSVLRRRFPDAVQHRDVRYLRGHELAPIDLLCGGFPCQPVADVGKRLAQDDPRWLWPHFARLIGILRPRWVVIENVRGLRTRGLDVVLRDLADLGFDAEWDLLPAAAFGAPHIRQRFFVVAYPNGHGLEGGLSTRPEGRPALQRRPLVFAESPGGEWPVEPDVARVADGVPSRVDRVRALGNAVVPQVAEWIGRRIVEAERLHAPYQAPSR